MALLYSCKYPTKFAGLCDMQAEHMMSVPIMPKSVSHCWIVLAVRAVENDYDLNTAFIASRSIALISTIVVVLSILCLVLRQRLGGC